MYSRFKIFINETYEMYEKEIVKKEVGNNIEESVRSWFAHLRTPPQM